MEHNVQKHGLINLAAATVIFVAALVVTTYVKSLAGEVCSVFLGLGALVAFTSWFQMRLEENERLEKMEVEELARTRGESKLFESKEAEAFPAQRVREQFEKFIVPGFSVLLFLLEGGGAYLLWRWISKATGDIAPDRIMPALTLFGVFALLLFLIGRFSVTVARLENQRLLRPGASFLLAGAYICFVTALGIAGVKAGFPKVDFYVTHVLCVLLSLMAVEMLITLLLEIYRPRVKDEIVRPLYDSRLVGLLAQPEGLFTTAAQALDYQFGFKVSETWFFKLLQKNLALLLLAQLAVLLLSTCVVFIDAGEQAVLERFGKPVAERSFDTGRAFKAAVAGGQNLPLPHGSNPVVCRRLHTGYAKRKRKHNFVEREPRKRGQFPRRQPRVGPRLKTKTPTLMTRSKHRR